MMGLDRWRIGEPDDATYRTGILPVREIPRVPLSGGAQ
jgi:hypothetical protein